MESLFPSAGIYSPQGQTYEPVDADQLLYYKEAKNGQLIDEGITEAGSMAEFTAAATSYATHGEPMIPSTSSMPCSVSSGPATSSGRSPTRWGAGSSSEPPPAARR